MSLFVNLKGRYLNYFRQYDGQPLFYQGFDIMDDRSNPLLLADVGQQIPRCSLDDVLGNTHVYSENRQSYPHPYRKDKRSSQLPLIFSQSYVTTPIGKRNLFDLEIEEVNHFITKGGIVNKNCFDEVSDFSESQYTFINTWNRSTKPGERCRIVAAGNPPTRPEGLWVMKRWAAWLDQSHPRPAKPGEVRWYLRPDDGDEIEVDGKGPYEIDGRSMEARSRTFIPALLGDNPDLSATDYAAMLDSLPKELRDAYRDGKFNTMLADGAFQTIPSEWVMLAMDRWTDKPPEGVPMCAIGLDVAQGGTDLIVAAPRYDAWFAPLITESGRNVKNGAQAAGFVMSIRRDNALIIIDMGGGYGGACYEWLDDNDVPVKGYKGAEASTRRTLDRQLSFYNKRSEAYWLFREALDPGQPGGSQIALPFDRAIIADLCAPTFTVGPRGIQVEPKELVCKRLKRSPDKGDSVVISWSGGNKLENMVKGQWPAKGRNFKPKVITSGRVNPRR